MKLFKSVDERFEELGFKKTYESKIVITYEKKIEEYNYIHSIEICKKSNGNNIVISGEKSVNKDGFNNAVGLTKQEMKLCIKKMREVGL